MANNETLILNEIRAALAPVAGYTSLCDNNPIVSRRTHVEVQGATDEHADALRAAGYRVEVRETPVVNRDGAVLRTRRTVTIIR